MCGTLCIALMDVRGAEDKICFLIVFGLRCQEVSQTGKPVQADAASEALLAVGQGIANLGQPDPRKQAPGSEHNHPSLSAFLKTLGNQDSPATRAHPANATIVTGTCKALDFEDNTHRAFNEHCADLCIIAFHWLLRPAKCTHS